MKELTKIWDHIAAGDESAFEEMYMHYFKRFYAYGKKITEHTTLVEDAIHDVMVKIWQNRESLKDLKNPAAYYYTSFRNILFDKLKKQNLIITGEQTNEAEDSSPEEQMIETETQFVQIEKLKQSFSELTPRQLEAVFLRFYHKMSYEEVATILGITVKATYKLLARSVERLKNEYLSILLIISLLSCFYYLS